VEVTAWKTHCVYGVVTDYTFCEQTGRAAAVVHSRVCTGASDDLCIAASSSYITIANSSLTLLHNHRHAIERTASWHADILTRIAENAGRDDEQMTLASVLRPSENMTRGCDPSA
jgi:hypothetical protein